MRDFKERAMYRAGRLDLFMEVYLPYRERFVTRDPLLDLGPQNVPRSVVKPRPRR
jgi:hypothetical protein